jgi:hypothetical protein
VQELKGRYTYELNLSGNVVLPGFIDSHVHLIDGGLQVVLHICLSLQMTSHPVKLFRWYSYVDWFSVWLISELCCSWRGFHSEGLEAKMSSSAGSRRLSEVSMNYAVPSPSLAMLLLIILVLSIVCSDMTIHLAVSDFCYICISWCM